MTTQLLDFNNIFRFKLLRTHEKNVYNHLVVMLGQYNASNYSLQCPE